MKCSAHNIVSPDLVPVTKGFSREAFDTGRCGFVLYIGACTKRLSSGTQSFNGGSVEGWRWLDAELQARILLETRNPRIIEDH